jgi:predicted unusual protein kinase regulating ubiquinone biosynthesis (AarF/ABC1/UbiB family)
VGAVAGTFAGQALLASARAVAQRRKVGPALAEGCVDAMERLGPTFVKLGQLAASSPGLFPTTLSEACRRCLDRLEPAPFTAVREVVEADLGLTLDEAFAEFDEVPLSAASTAQVHACVLNDGREAVVKVQRPDIAERMNTDLRIMHRAARVAGRVRRLAGANPVGIVEDLHRVTTQELDLALEARRQDQFRSTLHDFGDNLEITAPEVYWERCGPRTLCMQRVYGTPIDRFSATPGFAEVDTERLVRVAVKAWLEAACVHGPFHGDVHAGNVWVLVDGRLAFLDFGIMGELESGWKRVLATMLEVTALTGDYATLARAFKDVGAIPEAAGSDEDTGLLLAALLDPLFDQSLEEIGLGVVLQTTVRMFVDLGAIVPTEMVLILKQLVYFERYAKELAPTWLIGRDPVLCSNLSTRREAR